MLYQALAHEVHSSGALDLTGNLPVDVRGNASHTTREDLTSFSRELREKIRIEVVELVRRDIHTATRHLTVKDAEITETFFVLRLHNNGIKKA
jgi:hypothetical protein